MKKTLIKLVQPALDHCGLRLLREKEYMALCRREAIYAELTLSASNKIKTEPRLRPEIVIFSKDRALQLHALLESLFHHVTGNYNIQILYHAATEAHQIAYKQVAKIVASHGNISWIRETNFRDDLIRAMSTVTRDAVCFLVDDIVFTRPLDLESLDWATYSKGILSLRLGADITYCYTVQKPTQVPALSPANEADETLKFSWEESSYDWSYPLSVDGHVFPTHELQIAAKALHYAAPNSFERALKTLAPLYKKRIGYCFKSPKILNIPLNRVQNEIENISGEISPEELLKEWQAGQMLDFKSLADIQSESVHKEVPVRFIQR